MANLDQMAAQLNAAIDRLDEMLAPLVELRRRAARDRTEFDDLKLDREQLLARIALLEDEARELAGVTDTVEGRLDAAIAEIRTALAR
jgi:chromosome segregation ATPase